MTDRHDDFERQLHDRLAAAEARVDASPGAPNLSAAFRSAWLRPAVVVATVAAAALAGALLVDQIPDRRVGDASSSPGAGVSAQARDGDFVLTLASPRATWTTQDAIQVTATLSYMGHEQGATIGAGGGPVVFSLQQLSGGTAALEGGQRLSCIHYSLGPGAALSRPFAKAGGPAGEPPFDLAFFQDPQLRLPPGRWQVRATLEYSVGDCLADPRRLDVSIEVDVVDGGDSSPSPDAGVQAQAQNGDLILTLSSRRSIWTTENAIEVVATLSYVGDLDMVDLRGGGGPIVFSLRQLSGGNAVLGGGQDQPCLSYPIGPRSPRVWPFIKAGTVAEFGPFDRAFFDDPDLRLPPGRWEVRAWLVYGIDECGDLSLAASIELEVVAAANVDCHVSTADCDLAIGAASRLLQEGDSSPLHVVVTSGRGLVWHAEVHACWDDGQYLLIDVIGSVGVDRPTSDEVAATVRQDAWDDPPCD